VRVRLLLAANLFAGLWLLELVAADWFPWIVSVALVAAPYVQWRAYRRLRVKHLADTSIQSLRSAMFTALALFLCSLSLAAVGLLVVVRAFGWLPPIDREAFLVLLAFPLLLMTTPAVEWLRLQVWPIAEAEAEA
jgi:hypothetical protein